MRNGWRIRLVQGALGLLLSGGAMAEPVAVRHLEGTSRGFLSARDVEGHLVAMGDFYEVAHGDRVTLHLIFHFRDGSLDDETAVYTQHRVFRLISEHHIQRGPFFAHPMEMTVDALSGQVTVRATGKDGKEEVKSEHMDLPADLANGLSFIVTKNLPPEGSNTVALLVATPKPRLVKLTCSDAGEDSFAVGGMTRKARRIEMKIDLGGVAGVVAPVIGKQPPDMSVWIVPGEAPAFVKMVGYLSSGGPTLTFELASPVWPQSPDAKIVTSK